MPSPMESAAELSPVKRALVEIRALRARVAELESSAGPTNVAREPVAIVGMGVRFPGGVVDAASFWKLLAEGRDAITEVPRERWDWRAYWNADADAPGAMVTEHGGFLKDIDRFDAAFFGVSPREAVMMDPQHRLALEVAWEAIENAGHSAAELAGSRTGVFLGIGNSDYGRAALGDLHGIDAYTGSGNSPAMIAGRVAYVLGLHGPALALDTSCSSSLVAVHMACAAIRNGDCEAALAGGVNLILSPELNVALSKAHMMAPDGRCKTFDDAADGYVRGEGCAVVMLKRLSAAMAEGDRVLAVIRGSAVNHDGRSGGLTAPNGPAQAAVIRQALAAAGVMPHEIGYVETHGTGTSLGDPIEVDTLGAVLGEGRAAESPLVLGSVKTNLGHTEAVSGMAGLMKAVLALQHGQIPPSLHLKKKNTHIAWDRLPVDVPAELRDWPSSGRRYAGVSSLGFSGTNAHVVLEEAPQREPRMSGGERRVHILAISARTETALETLRQHYVEALRACPAEELGDLCFTANAGRVHFAHRLAVVGESAGEMAAELEQSAGPRRFAGNAEEGIGRIGFLFTGQGSQYAGMGRELYAGSEVFRAAMERVLTAWEKETGESLTKLLYGEDAEQELKQARVAQPALFAVEYALSELWRSWGVEPALVLGHSLGEYCAAVVAGIFSVEDGLKLVRTRARLMDTLEAKGAMRSVSAPVERVRAAIAGYEKEVAIAVVNGRESVVISGAAGAVEEIAQKLAAEGVRTRALEVTHGFHSPLLEPILDEFERVAGEVKYSAPRMRMVSNRTGALARPGEMERARYWREQMRGTVEFGAGLETAIESGCGVWVEIGPQPHLTALAKSSPDGAQIAWLPSSRKGKNSWEPMLQALATLYVRGAAVNWKHVEKGHRIALPTYPFERQRYWLAAGSAAAPEAIWRRAESAALAQSKLEPIGVHVEEFEKIWECLHRLTIAEVLKTFRSFGVFLKSSEAHEEQSLIAASGIAAAHGKLMGRWMGLLAAAGHLERQGTRFMSRTPLPEPQLDRAWQEAEQALRNDPTLLQYLRNCSMLLREVLTGAVSPLETLFPGGSGELARNLYEQSSASRYGNLIAAATIEAAATGAAPNRRLRILELGGGTGATTSSVLPLLPADRVAYTFTDVSEMFLHRAAERFAAYPFLRYGLLDIEDPEQMATHAGSYDVVIAANVVHATRDLAATLTRVAGLLAPGGTLVLLETTKSMAWHDMTTALIEGWQKSEDDLRGTRTLMSAAEWKRALTEAGFAEVAAVPEEDSPAAGVGLHVILARAAAEGVRGESLPSAKPVGWTAIPPTEPTSAEVSGIDALLREAVPAERRGIVLNTVLEEIARVLRLSADAGAKKRDRLMDLGLDSLMAVELRNRLARRLGIEALPATLIFDYPTPDAIAGYLLERAGWNEAEAIPESVTATVTIKNFSAEEVDELAEEDVAALLRSRLSR